MAMKYKPTNNAIIELAN